MTILCILSFSGDPSFTTIISIFHNAALYLATQIKYEYTHIESSVSIAKSFNSEEIQKIYSICIKNLELINYAPNKKSAVEMTFIQIFNDLNFFKSEVSNNDNLLKEKNKSDIPSEIKKTISNDVPKSGCIITKLIGTNMIIKEKQRL